MTSSLKKIRIGYALAIVLLLGSYALILSTNRRLQREKNWVVNNYTLINKIGQLKMALGTAESNVRGYVIDGLPQFLNGFYAAREDLVRINSDIKGLARSSKVMGNNVVRLNDMTKRRMKDLSEAIAARQRLPDSLRSSSIGQANLAQTDSIYTLIEKMTGQEVHLMEQRMTKLNRFYTSTEAMTILSLILALIAALYAIVTFNHQYQLKRRADLTAAQYKKQLETNIEELSRKNSELHDLKGIEKLATIGRVARVVAHEVRNPLTNISLSTEQLQDLPCIKQEEEAQSLMVIINRNLVRIGQMVSDLLNATKFIQLEKTKEDINLILDDSLEMARDRLTLKKIKVIKDYAESICDIMVDRERLKLAFLNIIVNAIEAMEGVDGVLKLVTSKEGGKCVVSISDNGNGMDAHTIQNLFEPYFTLKKKGNGLGLTNTQNIILNHKGTIEVVSVVGQGATFRISLDLV